MRLDDFQTMVARLARDIPADYQGGVVAVEVSPKTVPHPLRADVYTLGECIPLEWSGAGADLQSRVVLYHGSFQALAERDAGFDWRGEAWETLTHELRHHLEWRANVAALEAYDWAAEQNFARHEGQPFDPAFYRSGEPLAPGVWKVDDDVFLESDPHDFTWHGRRYHVTWHGDSPAFLTLRGLAAAAAGEVVLVLPRPPSLGDFWRRRPVTQDALAVAPLDA